MTFAKPSSPEATPSAAAPPADAPEALAARLLARADIRIKPIRGRGRNNRLYKVQTSDGQLYALKRYPSLADDPRNRMGRETSALWFLAEHQQSAFPTLLAADPVARAALLSWAPGDPANNGVATGADIQTMLAIMERMHTLRDAVGADALVAASDAVFSLESAHRQVTRRIERLWEAAGDYPELDDFIRARLEPLRDRIFKRAEQHIPRESVLPIRFRTLSLSDFGLHNAMRDADGRLTFLDLEYFGWDDPVKALSDLLWQPAMALRGGLRATLCEEAIQLYEAGGDQTFLRRFAAYHPIMGLIWSMIILNPFLPGGANALRAAGHTEDIGKIRRTRLLRANRYADVLLTGCAGNDHPALAECD
ncbi:hypothetical protein [Magnetofaba australis]|uniref:Putative aminoglycoside phosphotransferase n=1 Tax=Magnetofaba australis IT-1 TaxID=1434232 RepID=A0A1Y2K4R1_9PROT|nr:hypothetical protein [Magnetofaba australis]OSM04216.1 putative aminoglycoside phosphotransferase [Magnetofaba australis IT-1]